MHAVALEDEARWEIAGIEEAQRRYYEAMAEAEIDESAGGRALLKQIIPPLTKLLAERQAEARDDISRAAGKGSVWAWPIQLLDAERLAIIGVTCALRQWINMSGEESGCPIASVALTIADTIRLQVEFDQWEASQERADADAKKAKDKDYRSLLAALRAAHPDITRSTWMRWKRKLDDVVKVEWSRDHKAALGIVVVEALVKASGGRFAIETIRLGPRTTATLKLSDETIEEMNERDARAAVARPLLMPMICPPNPWRYE